MTFSALSGKSLDFHINSESIHNIYFASFPDVHHIDDPKCATYVKSNRKKNSECDFRSLVILWIKKIYG